VICPYCDALNPDNVDICQSCRQRFLEEIDFTESLEKLTNIANEMVRRDIPADPSLFKREFSRIEEEINELLDRAVLSIENNLADIARLREEGLADLGDLDIDSFERLFDEFDLAQDQITRGLQSVRENLIDAKTSREISGGLYAYSKAMQGIRSAAARLQSITYESSDLSSLTKPPEDKEMLPEIFRSRRDMEKALKGLEAFNEFEDTRLIHFALLKLEKTHDRLLDLLRGFGETIEEEDYYLDEIPGYAEDYYDEEMEEDYYDEEYYDEEMIENGDEDDEYYDEEMVENGDEDEEYYDEEMVENGDEDEEYYDEEIETKEGEKEHPEDGIEEPDTEEGQEGAEIEESMEEPAEEETDKYLEETGDLTDIEKPISLVASEDDIIMPEEIEEAVLAMQDKGYESILRDEDWKEIVQQERFAMLEEEEEEYLDEAGIVEEKT